MQQFNVSDVVIKQAIRDNRRCRFWHATLRLRSAMRRHHPQRAVLSQIRNNARTF